MKKQKNMSHLQSDTLPIFRLVDNYLKWKQVNNPDGGKRHFIQYHPSAFGYCLRQMQYQKYEDEGYFKIDHPLHDPTLMRIFENGHYVHERWSKYFEGLGILRGYWRCFNPDCGFVHGKDSLIGDFKPEKCVCGWKKFHYEEISVYSKEMNLFGHCDAILDFSQFDPKKFEGINILEGITEFPQKPVVVDMKSINHFGFQEVAGGKPHDYYLIQLVIYANLLDCEFGMLWYENKNNQRTTFFKVEKNEELWVDIQKAAFEMVEMSQVTDDNGDKLLLLPPPKHFYKADEKCEKCRYQGMCHSSPIWDNPDLHTIREEFYGKML